MELFAKIVNGFYPLILFEKTFALNVWLWKYLWQLVFMGVLRKIKKNKKGNLRNWRWPWLQTMKMHCQYQMMITFKYLLRNNQVHVLSIIFKVWLKVVHHFQKSSILDVWQGFECDSVPYNARPEVAQSFFSSDEYLKRNLQTSRSFRRTFQGKYAR